MIPRRESAEGFMNIPGYVNGAAFSIDGGQLS
jgi:hypothetical protein